MLNSIEIIDRYLGNMIKDDTISICAQHQEMFGEQVVFSENIVYYYDPSGELRFSYWPDGTYYSFDTGRNYDGYTFAQLLLSIDIRLIFN